jgi:hypothetical protein
MNIESLIVEWPVHSLIILGRPTPLLVNIRWTWLNLHIDVFSTPLARRLIQTAFYLQRSCQLCALRIRYQICHFERQTHRCSNLDLSYTLKTFYSFVCFLHKLSVRLLLWACFFEVFSSLVKLISLNRCMLLGPFNLKERLVNPFNCSFQLVLLLLLKRTLRCIESLTHWVGLHKQDVALRKLEKLAAKSFLQVHWVAVIAFFKSRRV